MEKACEQNRFKNKLDGKPDMVCVTPSSCALYKQPDDVVHLPVCAQVLLGLLILGAWHCIVLVWQKPADAALGQLQSSRFC